MKATLGQAAKILAIFADVSGEQAQALLESGLLADLRDANVNAINRDEFRRLCGLKLLTPPPSFLTISVHPSVPFDRDKSKDGWTLEEDTISPCGTIQLELCKFLEPKESYVNGEVMVERSKRLRANLGQRHAEALLRNHYLIPENWRAHHLVFPGTAWRGSCGRYVPCLVWVGGQWFLRFGWLEYDWNSDYRLLSPSLKRSNK